MIFRSVQSQTILMTLVSEPQDHGRYAGEDVITKKWSEHLYFLSIPASIVNSSVTVKADGDPVY